MLQPSTLVEDYVDPLHSWSPVQPIRYDQYDTTSAPPAYPLSEHSGTRSHRARHSTHRNHHDLDTLSSISSSTPAPAKRRGRPPKNRTPIVNGNGNAYYIPSVPGPSKPSMHHTKSLPPKTHKSKANGTIQVRPARDLLCSFCQGTDQKNKDGVEERMISCARCGRSGHPSCLNMFYSRLKRTIFTYDWCCIECKICEICEVKGDDVSSIRMSCLSDTDV